MDSSSQATEFNPKYFDFINARVVGVTVPTVDLFQTVKVLFPTVPVSQILVINRTLKQQQDFLSIVCVTIIGQCLIWLTFLLRLKPREILHGKYYGIHQ